MEAITIDAEDWILFDMDLWDLGPALAAMVSSLLGIALINTGCY